MSIFSVISSRFSSTAGLPVTAACRTFLKTGRRVRRKLSAPHREELIVKIDESQSDDAGRGAASDFGLAGFDGVD